MMDKIYNNFIKNTLLDNFRLWAGIWLFNILNSYVMFLIAIATLYVSGYVGTAILATIMALYFATILLTFIVEGILHKNISDKLAVNLNIVLCFLSAALLIIYQDITISFVILTTVFMFSMMLTIYKAKKCK